MVPNTMNRVMVSSHQGGCTVCKPLSLPNRQPIYRLTVQAAHDPLPNDVVRLPLAIQAKKRFINPDFFGWVCAEDFLIGTGFV